jgi:uncharacterized DUF497 family protein
MIVLDTNVLSELMRSNPDAAVIAWMAGQPRDEICTTCYTDGKSYTVVWTWRDDARRIISFRRARHGEERAYRQAH